MSPCQPPSPVRRSTLATPSRWVRPERVAQKSTTAALCGIVTRMPDTFGAALSPSITSFNAVFGTASGTHKPWWPRLANVLESRRGDSV